MGALGFFTRSESSEADTPMGRLFAATMRGNAEMASQSGVKRVAEKQAEQNAKTSIKINPGGTVDIKNADPAVFDGTQQQEVQDAQDAPHVAVESALATTTATDDPLAPVYDIADKHLGYRVPRPSDPDIPEKLKTPDGIRELTQEMGGTAKDADAAIRAMRDGRLTVTDMRERVAAFRAKKFEAIQKTISPALNEVQDIEKGKRDASSESRLVADQRFRVRNQLLDQANTMQFGSVDEYLASAEKTMADVGGFRAGDREQFASAYRSTRAKVLGDRVRALSGDEGKKAIESYEDTPEDIQRFVDDQAGVANLTEFERNRLARVAKGLLEDKSDRQRKETQSIAAEARREAREVRSVIASERAAAEASRKNRIEERAEDREARITRQSVVTPLAKRLEELADKIRKNDIEHAKATTSPAEKKALQKQNREMLAELRDKRDQLSALVTFVDQADYDALIAAGHTPASIAADGIRLRKAKK